MDLMVHTTIVLILRNILWIMLLWHLLHVFSFMGVNSTIHIMVSLVQLAAIMVIAVAENTTMEQTSAFLPFGMGKQNCAAQSLANAENHCIMHASEFDFEIVDQGEAAFFMTLRTEGTKLLAHKASGTTAH